MTHEMLLHLLYQLPAAFTAVPMLARLLPFKLAERAIPLFYFLVCLLVMAMPGSVCLALGAAGLMSMLHVRLGEKLANVPGPDMAEVLNKLALGWDYTVTHLPLLPAKGKQVVMVDGGPVDVNQEHDDTEDDNKEYQEPPHPPEARIAQRIPHLD